MKKLIVAAVLALASIASTQSAWAYSCTTQCYGETCYTNCY